tara:strand:+ start:4608 stop:4937 length:330 start_codon:yes stop_codon:yes gene_type:complete
MKLTDLKLCKRIAEIEGFEHWVHGNGSLYASHNGGVYDEEYNPLINKELLFDLQLKYGVVIKPVLVPESYDVFIDNYDVCRVVFPQIKNPLSDSEIPRAILECIVEANK